MTEYCKTLVLPVGGITMNADSPPRLRYINRLLRESLMSEEDWNALSAKDQRTVIEATSEPKALERLVKFGLLTPYQAGRIEVGTTFGLVLGRYRLLERLGAGGMAVVFKAEHMDLRHHVAVKVLPPVGVTDSPLESRFFSEMRIVARLRHPNIVAATDAGRLPAPEGNTVLHYLVMEYVPGDDLDAVVRQYGPMSPARACAVAYQAASALAETHKYGLVHRDIKPSNLMLTGEDRVKLLDFGLTRNLANPVTAPGTVLGTIDYMAPEQARDASSVDIRADLYGLGATLYWCLTGRVPFPFDGNAAEALTRRMSSAPPSAHAANREVPPELSDVVAQMMALRPEDRPADPVAVMQALMPFLGTEARAGRHEGLAGLLVAENKSAVALPDSLPSTDRYRVLVVDDEASIRDLCRHLLEAEGAVVEVAATGEEGLARAAKDPFDLVLLDMTMPGMGGVEVLGRLREADPQGRVKVMMVSGYASPEDTGNLLARGADDLLTKPFSIPQFLGRVQSLLRLKAAQDQVDRLNRRLINLSGELSDALRQADGDGDGGGVRDALVSVLGRVVDLREGRGTGHPARMRVYCRTLAEAAARAVDGIDRGFINLLERTAPLHDVGRMGLPDHVLLKVGPLTAEERLTMETHTNIATDLLRGNDLPEGPGRDFVRMAAQIARHHHERFDGTGYPDRLAGDDIPLAARVVAIADAYDALRSRRLYKPALPHNSAVEILTLNSLGQFDPVLLEAFKRAATRFETIYEEIPD